MAWHLGGSRLPNLAKGSGQPFPATGGSAQQAQACLGCNGIKNDDLVHPISVSLKLFGRGKGDDDAGPESSDRVGAMGLSPPHVVHAALRHLRNGGNQMAFSRTRTVRI